jgi:hypothetical protein
MYVFEFYTQQLYYVEMNKWERKKNQNKREQLDSMITTKKKEISACFFSKYFLRITHTHTYIPEEEKYIYKKTHNSVFGF